MSCANSGNRPLLRGPAQAGRRRAVGRVALLTVAINSFGVVGVWVLAAVIGSPVWTVEQEASS